MPRARVTAAAGRTGVARPARRPSRRSSAGYLALATGAPRPSPRRGALGPAGIGKTRLSAELAGVAHGRVARSTTSPAVGDRRTADANWPGHRHCSSSTTWMPPRAIDRRRDRPSRRAFPRSPVLMLVTHREEAAASVALRGGADRAAGAATRPRPARARGDPGDRDPLCRPRHRRASARPDHGGVRLACRRRSIASRPMGPGGDGTPPRPLDGPDRGGPARAARRGGGADRRCRADLETAREL